MLFDIDRAAGTGPLAFGQNQQQQLMQQNQLVLSLNQSYFQLITNQNALVDRFNRLEQLVLGTSSPLGGGTNMSAGREERSPGGAAAPVDNLVGSQRPPRSTGDTASGSKFKLCIQSLVILLIMMCHTLYQSSFHSQPKHQYHGSPLAVGHNFSIPLLKYVHNSKRFLVHRLLKYRLLYQ